MTHKYEKILKVITERYGEKPPYCIVVDNELVKFAYAVLEEFEGPQETEFEESRGKTRILYAAYLKKIEALQSEEKCD